MQTTLLGLAIAFILALVAALVGPFFIDWSQFRPQFEAEASRVVGAPVRVSGALDARLLPAPSLQLHGITIGSANDLGRFRADRLDVEFSLGSLLRGEWRATELSVNGAAVDLGLNAQGRIDLPALTGPFNLGALAIDRLNVTGRAMFHDAASRASLELSDIAFSGDVRSLAAGAMRGDGNFMLSGTRYPFRISSGQSNDGNGTRFRLTIEAGPNSLSIDADGVLSFANRTPGFDGVLTLAKNAGAKVDGQPAKLANAPWRIVGKVKAGPAQAQFESIDASYGADESALKVTGVADLRFGASPLLHIVLPARQLDIDRLLAKETGADDKPTPIAALRRIAAEIPQPPIATRLEASAEQVMLGGRPLQNVGADLHGDPKSWTVERLEFRAPGATQVVLSSAAAQQGTDAAFRGAISVDSSDPDMLAAWLKGRSDARLRDQKPLRIRGNFSSAADRLAIDGLKAEIDGGALEGRMALAFASARGGSRIDADLKADRLDLDAAVGLVRSLSGPHAEWPDAGQLSLDIGRAISAGQEMRPFAAQLSYSPQSISLDRFKVGEATGLMLEGNGGLDRSRATGKFVLNASAPSVARISAIVAPFAPAAALRLDRMPAVPGPVALKFALGLDDLQPKSDRANARLSLDINAPQVKGLATIVATPALAAVRGFDFDALSRSDLTLETRLTGQGKALMTLSGLDSWFAVGDAPLTFEAHATGGLHAPFQLKTKLQGVDFDAELQGGADPWAKTPKAALTLALRDANAAPLLGLDAKDVLAQKISLASRVVWNGDTLGFEDFDSTFAGSRMRGRVSLNLGKERAIDGQLGTDRIDLAPIFSLVTGTRGPDASEPIGAGLLQGWSGKLEFQSLRATLPGGTELRPFSGVLKSDGRSLTIDAIKAKIGGGDLTADLDWKPAPTGYALGARLEMSGVDGSALAYRSLTMPAGKTSLKMSIASQGRSASALEGAIAGSGLVTIDALRIPGLDPRMFDVAIKATDAGQATNDTRLRQIVEPALARGEFAVLSAQFPFSIKDSRLRVGATTLETEGARAIVSGGYDIVADQADIRVSLSGMAAGGSSVRPEIQLFTAGTPDKLDRSVDVAALSSWLAVRAIDRETRRLDQLERSGASIVVPPATAPQSSEGSFAGDAPTASAPAADVPLQNKDSRRPPAKAAPRPVITPAVVPPVVSQQVAPLPAPIEVRPSPGTPRTTPRPRPSAPLVLTPPAAIAPARPPF